VEIAGNKIDESAQFIPDFRRAGGDANNNAIATDAIIRNYMNKTSPDGSKLTGYQAGQAFNNG